MASGGASKGTLVRCFLKGRITSGLLKAVGGLLCSVIAVLWFGGGCSFTSLVVGVALICSSANGINLLDKRPSRAIKAFWMLCVVSIVFSRHELRMLPFMLILSTLPYSYYDFTSKAMLRGRWLKHAWSDPRRIHMVSYCCAVSNRHSAHLAWATCLFRETLFDRSDRQG